MYINQKVHVGIPQKDNFLSFLTFEDCSWNKKQINQRKVVIPKCTGK